MVSHILSKHFYKDYITDMIRWKKILHIWRMDPWIREKNPANTELASISKQKYEFLEKKALEIFRNLPSMLQPSGAREQSPSAGFLGAANRAALRGVTRSSTRTGSRSPVLIPVPGWSLSAPLLSRELSRCHWPLFHSLQQQTSFSEGQHPLLYERAIHKLMETRK